MQGPPSPLYSLFCTPEHVLYYTLYCITIKGTLSDE